MIARMMRKLAKERYPTWDEVEAFLAAREQPKAETPRLADEHVRRAAHHLQAMSARELKEKEEAMTRQRTEEERADLLRFWGDHVHAHLSACVAPLNSELGLSLEVARKRNEIQFSFLKATLHIHLFSTPTDLPGFFGPAVTWKLPLGSLGLNSYNLS